jgi:hypothetical protein
MHPFLDVLDHRFGRLARSAGSQVLPRGEAGRPDSLDVDVRWHATDEPDPQRAGSREQSQAGSAALNHPAETALPVARQEEARRDFLRRAQRKRLPTADEILAPHQPQGGRRLVQVALSPELLDWMKRNALITDTFAARASWEALR